MTEPIPANIFITKLSCVNKYYVLIGGIICQLCIYVDISLKKTIRSYFGTISQITKLRKVYYLTGIAKNKITKQPLYLAFEQVIVIYITTK